MTNKGKISKEIIDQLKATHPETPLFKKPLPPSNEDEVVFMPITIPLLKRISAIVRDAEAQGRGLPIEDVNERIFDECVLWPKLTIEEKFTLPVGVIPSVVKAIQEKSGYIEVDIYQRVLSPDTLTTIIKDFDYWPDMTLEELEELKKSPFSLFKVIIGRWIFAIRPMTRADIQIASQAADDQLTLAKSVVMWPREVKWDNIPAGIVEILGRRANEISGWSETSRIEEL